MQGIKAWAKANPARVDALLDVNPRFVFFREMPANDVMPASLVAKGLAENQIEIAPLAFMRGRTLANSVVILDEAQNTTSMQMKMFLTRLGENSRMIVTGDPTQVDLPPGQTSGLAEATRLLKNVEGVGLIAFTAADVIRHELVARIVEAYDKAPRRPAPSRNL